MTPNLLHNQFFYFFPMVVLIDPLTTRFLDSLSLFCLHFSDSTCQMSLSSSHQTASSDPSVPCCYFWLPSGLIQHGAPGPRLPVLWQVTLGHTLSPVTCGGQPVIPVHSSSVHTHPAGRAHTNAVIHRRWTPARSSGCKRRFSRSQHRLKRTAPEIHLSLLFPLLLHNNIFFSSLTWCPAFTVLSVSRMLQMHKQGWFDWMVPVSYCCTPLSWHSQLTELMTTHSRCPEGATGQSANTRPHSTS